MAEKTDREWIEFCRPFVFMNGSHEMPNYPALCRAVAALSAPPPAGAQQAVAPTANEIAQTLPNLPAGYKCPLGGHDEPHEHSPREITIYRNGVKWGLRNEKQPWKNDPSPSQDAGHDAISARAALRLGANEHLQHRAGQADDQRTSAECDSGGTGVSSEGSVREAVALAALAATPAPEAAPSAKDGAAG